MHSIYQKKIVLVGSSALKDVRANTLVTNYEHSYFSDFPIPYPKFERLLLYEINDNNKNNNNSNKNNNNHKRSVSNETHPTSPYNTSYKCIKQGCEHHTGCQFSLKWSIISASLSKLMISQFKVSACDVTTN